MTLDEIAEELKDWDLIIEDGGKMYKVKEIMIEDYSLFFFKGDEIK